VSKIVGVRVPPSAPKNREIQRWLRHGLLPVFARLTVRLSIALVSAAQCFERSGRPASYGFFLGASAAATTGCTAVTAA
jgi:hypothetical protein